MRKISVVGGVRMSASSAAAYRAALAKEKRKKTKAAVEPKEQVRRIPSSLMRWDIINHMLNGVGRFLEIGVQQGETGRRILAAERWGVDPAPKPETRNVYTRLVQATSDAFFEGLSPTEKFDVVFIDGLHEAEQVYRDVENSLRHLNDNGVILMHDCNPTTEQMQLPELQPGQWTGDCWKAVVRLRSGHDDLRVHVLDTDFGIGVVRRGQSTPIQLTKDWSQLGWSDLVADRRRLLGLVPSLYHETPVFLISYEVHRWLRDMVDDLLRMRLTNIHIVDNASTYEPLLQWFEELPAGVQVHRLEENLGKYAPWKTGLVNRTARSAFYVVSDPDLDLSGLPEDTVEHFVAIAKAHPRANKIGSALRIDDIPSTAICGSYAPVWEQGFWNNSVGKDIYRAKIDTTFALVRSSKPDSKPSSDDLRCADEYTVRHLPWYLGPEDFGGEERHRYPKFCESEYGTWSWVIGNTMTHGPTFDVTRDDRRKAWMDQLRRKSKRPEKMIDDGWRVVIPSNDAARLRRAVASILKTHPGSPPDWIVVVDDGAKKDWRPSDPNVSWVYGEKPFVYAVNANIGIQAAGPYDVVLMGDDVEVQTPVAFNRLRSSRAIVSPLVHGPVRFASQKFHPAKRGRQIVRGEELAFVCVFLPQELLAQVGDLDPRFVHYGCEDIDYCWRARDNGFDLEIESSVVVRHNAPGMESAFRSQPNKSNRGTLQAKWPDRRLPP